MLQPSQIIIWFVSKTPFLRDKTEAFLAFVLIISRFHIFQNIICSVSKFTFRKRETGISFNLLVNYLRIPRSPNDLFCCGVRATPYWFKCSICPFECVILKKA